MTATIQKPEQLEKPPTGTGTHVTCMHVVSEPTNLEDQRLEEVAALAKCYGKQCKKSFLEREIILRGI